MLHDSIETLFKEKYKKYKAGLTQLEIKTIYDLLYHLPTRYDLYSTNETSRIQKGEKISITGKITSIGMRRTMGQKRVMVAEATIETSQTTIKAIWFHQPYIAKQFKKDDIVQLVGAVSGEKKKYLTNPIIQKTTSIPLTGTAEKPPQSSSRIPIYPETYGISSRLLHAYITKALRSIPEEEINRSDPIPEYIQKKIHLPSLYHSLQFIHNPKDDTHIEVAKKRFMFEAVFTMQVMQQFIKNQKKEMRAYNIAIKTKDTNDFIKKQLPFTLTSDQKKAIKDILGDIKKNKPMTRLLEGDVGSGKTAVAATVIHSVIQATPEEKTSARPQIVYLAPTEILAQQQFEELVTLFKHLPIQMGFISGKKCLKFPSKLNPEETTPVSKKQLKNWMETGELAVIVGTHALVQKNILFKRLTLVIIDEQHKFGVSQRHHLFKNTETHLPHLLSMSATPIPRTLALTLYGDLDISVIKEMPKGRKLVKTALLKQKNISKAYQHIREEVENGRQAYILCPRIKQDEKSDLRSVEEEYTYIKKHIFPDQTIEMLHGQMKQKDKDAIIKDFLEKKIDILVTTTVIEVGVNIPNATIITILHAERYGLAQLHQLRGRVMRSSHQPYCYAISNSTNQETLKRLTIFEKKSNGFDLAQEDFFMRGGGEIAGTKQSGIPDIAMEGIKNPNLVAISQEEAKHIIQKDPDLHTHHALRDSIFQKHIHAE